MAYYNLPTHDLVKAAQEYIEEIIEEEGPFDGVIGFSQGAALASSLILEHAKKDPLNDLFKLAFFAGASLPFEVASNTNSVKGFPFMMEDFGASDSSSDDELDMSKRAPLQREDSDMSFSSAEDESATPPRMSLQREDSSFSDSSFDDEIDPYTSWRIPRNFFHPVGPLLGRYHPERTPTAQLKIPTLHMIGSRDEYAEQAHIFSKMCAGQPTVLNHSEGHRIPRDKAFQDKAAREMERLISKVSLTC